MAHLNIRNVAIAAIMCGAALVASCTNMEQMPGPGNGRPGAAMCPKVYAPVCGAKGYQRRTFNNSCLAQSRGFSVVSEGRCGRPQ
jgi:hypothetical protein